MQTLFRFEVSQPHSVWKASNDIDLLALSHKASFMQETNNSLEDFLAIYKSHKDRVILEYRTGGASFDYQRSYANCWILSFSELKSEPASRLLGIIALLYPDVTSDDLLQGYASSKNVDIGPLTDTVTCGIAIAQLRRHALVKYSKTLIQYSCHRLIQDASIRYLNNNGLLQL